MIYPYLLLEDFFFVVVYDRNKCILHHRPCQSQDRYRSKRPFFTFEKLKCLKYECVKARENVMLGRGNYLLPEHSKTLQLQSAGCKKGALSSRQVTVYKKWHTQLLGGMREGDRVEVLLLSDTSRKTRCEMLLWRSATLSELLRDCERKLLQFA